MSCTRTVHWVSFMLISKFIISWITDISQYKISVKSSNYSPLLTYTTFHATFRVTDLCRVITISVTNSNQDDYTQSNTGITHLSPCDCLSLSCNNMRLVIDKCLLRPVDNVSCDSMITVTMVTLTHYRDKRIIEDIYPVTRPGINLTNQIQHNKWWVSLTFHWQGFCFHKLVKSLQFIKYFSLLLNICSIYNRIIITFVELNILYSGTLFILIPWDLDAFTTLDFPGLWVKHNTATCICVISIMKYIVIFYHPHEPGHAHDVILYFRSLLKLNCCLCSKCFVTCVPCPLDYSWYV